VPSGTIDLQPQQYTTYYMNPRLPLIYETCAMQTSNGRTGHYMSFSGIPDMAGYKFQERGKSVSFSVQCLFYK
jgi:hypothetical protein